MKTGGRELTEETDKEKKRENNKTKGKDREFLRWKRSKV